MAGIWSACMGRMWIEVDIVGVSFLGDGRAEGGAAVFAIAGVAPEGHVEEQRVQVEIIQHLIDLSGCHAGYLFLKALASFFGHPGHHAHQLFPGLGRQILHYLIHALFTSLSESCDMAISRYI